MSFGGNLGNSPFMFCMTEKGICLSWHSSCAEMNAAPVLFFFGAKITEKYLTKKRKEEIQGQGMMQGSVRSQKRLVPRCCDGKPCSDLIFLLVPLLSRLKAICFPWNRKVPNTEPALWDIHQESKILQHNDTTWHFRADNKWHIVSATNVLFPLLCLCVAVGFHFLFNHGPVLNKFLAAKNIKCPKLFPARWPPTHPTALCKRQRLC